MCLWPIHSWSVRIGAPETAIVVPNVCRRSWKTWSSNSVSSRALCSRRVTFGDRRAGARVSEQEPLARGAQVWRCTGSDHPSHPSERESRPSGDARSPLRRAVSALAARVGIRQWRGLSYRACRHLEAAPPPVATWPLRSPERGGLLPPGRRAEGKRQALRTLRDLAREARRGDCENL